MKTRENNLLICISRFSQNSKTNCKLGEDQMIKILGIKEIRALLAKQFLAEVNRGLE